MKIVITMAGDGRRFKEIGLQKPKYELLASGKTLFYWSMRSMQDFFDDEFIFIAQRQTFVSDFITKECWVLGIKNFRIIQLDERTQGQASTVMKCIALMDDDDEFAVYNIDTYVHENEILRSSINLNCNGWIPVFEAEGDKWSFVSADDDGNVTAITEKVRISNLATIGFYYFSKWIDFKNYYNRFAIEVKDTYHETYIAPLYAYYLSEGRSVKCYQIKASEVHALGTPEDCKQFDPDFLTINQ